MDSQWVRAVPDDLAPESVAAIDAMLDAIRREHGVRIPLAIESGSRAWGFPSPDSDYDCRFVYVRPVEAHLTVWPVRDVIEAPIQGELDVNGWDLAKALRLLLKGNAVVVEWLRSPIVYGADPDFRAEVLAFAEAWADAARIAAHYLHLSRRQRAVYLDGQTEVALKKVFYALRPAMALRWMRLHPGEPLPPMHFPTLLAESEPSAEVTGLVADLVARKARTREMGTGSMPPALLAFIDAELALAEGAVAGSEPKDRRAAAEAADALYRRLVR